MHNAKQLAIDLTPLTSAIVGVNLVSIHEALSIVAVAASIVYTFFKIKKDFF